MKYVSGWHNSCPFYLSINNKVIWKNPSPNLEDFLWPVFVIWEKEKIKSS